MPPPNIILHPKSALHLVALLLLVYLSDGFSPVFPIRSDRRTQGRRLVHRLNDPTSVNLFWFGGGKDDNDDKRRREREERGPDAAASAGKGRQRKQQQVGGGMGGAGSSSSQGVMGGTAAMMESFKQSQDVGKKTTSLLQDLAATVTEGSAANGKVRVFMDGQQRPTGVDVDEKYLATASADDLNVALLAAMRDAHKKSTDVMEEKMQVLYAEIGLPAMKST